MNEFNKRDSILKLNVQCNNRQMAHFQNPCFSFEMYRNTIEKKIYIYKRKKDRKEE